MDFKAVLFDLDGTLLDTVDDIADSMNAVLARSGLPVQPVELYRYLIGDGLEVLVRKSLPEDRRTPDVVAEYLRQMAAEYGRRWSNKTRPYREVPDLLDALTRRRVRLAILSNKMEEFVKKSVARMLSNWPFEAVIGERPGLPRKPDPTGALDVAGRLGVAPERFAYLGDSGTDMLTANAAGMYAVGALWGFRSGKELLANGAKVLIRHPAELLDVLDGR